MEKEKKTTLKFKNPTYSELQLIAAEVNARGVGTYLDDLLSAWSFAVRAGEISIKIEQVTFLPDQETSLKTHRINPSTLYELRILAVKAGMSLKNYMESVGEWMANEHRENGRYWFDETPKRSLPIRTRG